jgi:hypothetical protein
MFVLALNPKHASAVPLVILYGSLAESKALCMTDLGYPYDVFVEFSSYEIKIRKDKGSLGIKSHGDDVSGIISSEFFVFLHGTARFADEVLFI